MSYTSTGTILDRILARTARDLETRKDAVPVTALERQAAAQPEALRLRERLARPGMAVIAEIKRASPSKGLFPVTVEPAVVAAEYIAGGAAAISVLTDKPHFGGSLGDLAAAAKVARGSREGTPILRKDFVIDQYQIVEARANGADAVLLIVAALDDAALRGLLKTANDLGMDALVEVHDEEEMRRAAAAGASVIGINNRDLRSFTVDLAVSERLAPLAPDDAIVVAESGVFGCAEVRRLARAGAAAVLVGEGLICAVDRAGAVRALRSCAG
jgi:indole-3-glycerol phosphate synthase